MSPHGNGQWQLRYALSTSSNLIPINSTNISHSFLVLNMPI